MDPLIPADPSRVGGYRLLGRLGAGGMGVVYLARAEDGELAAVKVIRPEHADEAGFRARFRREVAAARQVVSPWAVPVLGADVEARAPWLATAFVAGPSLAEVLGESRPLTAREVRVLGKTLARALAAVHAAGLVHRDVKPGNVLLTLDGPRLIDFGIVRSQASDETTLTSTGLVVGTPGFLSPEQARAEAVTGASDVFSLGCVLAYAASGRLPFGTGEAEAVLYRTVHDEPDLGGLRGADTDGPPDAGRDGDAGGGVELLAVLRRCLAKDPGDRPSAEELDGALVEDVPRSMSDWLPESVVRLIAARAEAALALPDVERTTVVPARPARRRVLAWGGGGALLAAAGGTGLWALLRDDDGGGAAPTKGKSAGTWAIGVHADLTGPRKAAGVAQQRGARLAVEQFNAEKRKPFTVVLRAADDGGDAQRAAAVARRFTEDDEVLAVLGPTGDETVGAVVGAYDEASLPLLSVSTPLPGPAGSGRAPSHFMTLPPYGYAATADAALFRSRGSRRVGVLWHRSGGSWSSTLGLVTQRILAGNGLGTYARVVPRGVEELAPVVRDMVGQGIDGFHYTGGPDGGAAVVRALAARDFDGPRLLGYPCVDAGFLREAGGAADGWETFAPFIGPSAEPLRDFAAAYRKKYGEAPGHWAAEGFDVTRMVLRRLTELARGGSRPTRGRLVAALAKGTYRGLVRTYAFDEERELKNGGFFRHRIDGGRLRYLGPAPAPE